MRSFLALAAVAMVAASLLSSSPAQAAAKNSYWIGKITHVSTTNIKVVDKSGKELSFLLLPKFKNIWSDDGKTTYQTAFLKNGQKVEVIYDQRALGARHADKIIVLRR